MIQIHKPKLEINVNKCKVIIYAYNKETKHRVANMEEEYEINNRTIPKLNLAEYTEYLGVSTAASMLLRMKSTEEKIEEAMNMINAIKSSGLKLNQKIDAVKRFAIPSLDYIMSQGKPTLKDMDKIDKEIRKMISNEINAPISNAYTETNWKDGGLSIQPLHLRLEALKIKTLCSLMNSNNIETRELFKVVSEKERNYRGVELRKDTTFLNWETNNFKVIQKRRGTSSMFGECKTISEKKKIAITFDDENRLGIKTDETILTYGEK